MTKYREILRLSCQGFSERNIALSCSVSCNTVAKVLQAASEKNISWPLDESQTDKVLETVLFPKDSSKDAEKLRDIPRADKGHKDIAGGGHMGLQRRI